MKLRNKTYLFVYQSKDLIFWNNMILILMSKFQLISSAIHSAVDIDIILTTEMSAISLPTL